MPNEEVTRTFGIEEEYLLLDAATGDPTDSAAELILATPELGEQTEREYFSSQLETSTSICHEADEAEASLSRFRSIVAQAADRCGVVLAGTGLPATGGETVGTVTPKPRYRRIETEIRGVGAHQYLTGTHVHVAVPSSDAGVEVIARIARWVPALLALTANSPLWCGEPTGFASWRHIMALTMPVAGFPQTFADGAAYEQAVARLIDSGVILDTGLVSWVIRLSSHYPTVELRIADSQLRAADAVAFAALVRALVDRALSDFAAGIERPIVTPGLVNGADWIAARNGLSSDLVDPVTAERLPAFEFIDRMLGTVEGELDYFGDRSRIDRYLKYLREQGTPASRQLAAFGSGGVASLLSLYRESNDELSSPHDAKRESGAE
ncbi:MAG: YbdK family carboxylate-amine ligase [Actinobacteria bacterium]|nr:YbdK family carboxylate-amine ligase [Actinomycetota bacterium]